MTSSEAGRPAPSAIPPLLHDAAWTKAPARSKGRVLPCLPAGDDRLAEDTREELRAAFEGLDPDGLREVDLVQGKRKVRELGAEDLGFLASTHPEDLVLVGAELAEKILGQEELWLRLNAGTFKYQPEARERYRGMVHRFGLRVLRPLLAGVEHPPYVATDESSLQKLRGRGGDYRDSAVDEIAALLGQLVYFDAPSVAALAAAAIHHGGKEGTAGAAQWIERRPEAAAAGLVPRAVGPLGVERDEAWSALRWMMEHGFDEDVRKRAALCGPEVESELWLLVAPGGPFPAKVVSLPRSWKAAAFPKPRLLDGGELDELAVDNLHRLLAVVESEKDPRLEAVRAACTQDSLAEFTFRLFDTWLGEGAPGKQGYLYTALSYFHDDRTPERLTPHLLEFKKQGKHQRFDRGMSLLEQMGSDAARALLQEIRGKNQAAQQAAQQARFEQTKRALARQWAEKVGARLGEGSAAGSLRSIASFTPNTAESSDAAAIPADKRRHLDGPAPAAILRPSALPSPRFPCPTSRNGSVPLPSPRSSRCSGTSARRSPNRSANCSVVVGRAGPAWRNSSPCCVLATPPSRRSRRCATDSRRRSSSGSPPWLTRATPTTRSFRRRSRP